MTLKLYRNMIEELKKIVMKWLEDKEIGYDKEKFSKVFSTALVLSAEYGAGDAYAGLLLKQIPYETVKIIIDVLEKLGVDVSKPSPHVPPFIVFWELMRSDFHDEKMNEAMRELQAYMTSGGKHAPNFAKEKES